MRLYFLRHADAGDREAWRGDDALRPLTDKGYTQAKAVGAGLARLRTGVRAILTSPYVRAYETAEIVGKALELPAETFDELQPGFGLPELDRALALRPDVEGALFVGHEPDLSQLIDKLLRTDRKPRPHVTMKKAACCLILTPTAIVGGASATGLAGACELGWLRTWREWADLSTESDLLF